MLQIDNFEVKTFEVLEAGTYRVRLADIEEIEGKKWGSEELEKRWKWIFETIKETNSVYEPFKLFYFTKPVYTLHDKAKLTIVLKGLAGKKLTAKEYKAFMTSPDLIGRQVDVVISKDEKTDGKVFNNIVAFFPVTNVITEDEEEDFPENLF